MLAALFPTLRCVQPPDAPIARRARIVHQAVFSLSWLPAESFCDRMRCGTCRGAAASPAGCTIATVSALESRSKALSCQNTSFA